MGELALLVSEFCDIGCRWKAFFECGIQANSAMVNIITFSNIRKASGTFVCTKVFSPLSITFPFGHFIYFAAYGECFG